MEDESFFFFLLCMGRATDPYDFTRAPYIANLVRKPFVDKWRKLG